MLLSTFSTGLWSELKVENRQCHYLNETSCLLKIVNIQLLKTSSSLPGLVPPHMRSVIISTSIGGVFICFLWRRKLFWAGRGRLCSLQEMTTVKLLLYFYFVGRLFCWLFYLVSCFVGWFCGSWLFFWWLVDNNRKTTEQTSTILGWRTGLGPEQTRLIFSVDLEKKGAELFPTSTLQDLLISNGLMHVDEKPNVRCSGVWYLPVSSDCC